MCRHLSEVETGEDVTRWLEKIWGDRQIPRAGILHVTAVWRQPTGGYRTLNINDATPKSDHDLFMLGVARARADAIVTTGKILRAEPALNHDLPGSPRLAAALGQWRKRVLERRPDRPLVVILTSGRNLEPEHPAFHAWARPVIYTSKHAATNLREELAVAAIDVVGSAQPDLRDAIAYLRSEAGCRTISIEAGPSTSGQLYEPPVLVDELMLSAYLGATVPDGVVGAPFLGPERLGDLFGRRSAEHHVTEPSGEWSFSRWRR